MDRASGVRNHCLGLGGRGSAPWYGDIPSIKGARGLPGNENPSFDPQGAAAGARVGQLDAINQHKRVETVEIVERDNKTVRKHKLHFVFLNTKSGLPHVSDFVVRDRFFKAYLLAAGVRYRGPGQCRHTYASQLLTTGVASVDWIAEQMGHTSANMIRQHYGTWINEDGPDVVGMLQHALGMQLTGTLDSP